MSHTVQTMQLCNVAILILFVTQDNCEVIGMRLTDLCKLEIESNRILYGLSFEWCVDVFQKSVIGCRQCNTFFTFILRKNNIMFMPCQYGNVIDVAYARRRSLIYEIQISSVQKLVIIFVRNFTRISQIYLFTCMQILIELTVLEMIL